jgi:hypothetical protein
MYKNLLLRTQDKARAQRTVRSKLLSPSVANCAKQNNVF